MHEINRELRLELPASLQLSKQQREIVKLRIKHMQESADKVTDQYLDLVGDAEQAELRHLLLAERRALNVAIARLEGYLE